MKQMKTYIELNEQLALASNDQQEQVDQKIAQMTAFKAAHAAAMLKLQTKMLPLTKALEEVGLCVSSLGHFKTGMSDDHFNWQEGAALAVEVSAQPVGGKFKFLTFNGYAASGAGRNQARLQQKADKLAGALSAALGVAVSVNPFSLEVEGQGDRKNVLISFRIN